MAMLLYLLCLQSLLGSVIGKPQIAPELFLNRLNISYGINYKYNGQLNHNIDRVWVVTKIKIPKYEEIKFPNISFDPECKFLESLNNGNTYRYMSCVTEMASFPCELTWLASLRLERTQARCSDRCTPVEYPSPDWYAPFGSLSPSR